MWSKQGKAKRSGPCGALAPELRGTSYRMYMYRSMLDRWGEVGTDGRGGVGRGERVDFIEGGKGGVMSRSG